MNSTLMLVNGRLNNRSEKSGAGGGNALPPGGEKSGGGIARGGKSPGGEKSGGGNARFPIPYPTMLMVTNLDNPQCTILPVQSHSMVVGPIVPT